MWVFSDGGREHVAGGREEVAGLSEGLRKSWYFVSSLKDCLAVNFSSEKLSVLHLKECFPNPILSTFSLPLYRVWR
jgi:hypothetical protein